MHPGPNHKQMPHSADALVRVDYDALALSATATSWRVFVSEDAPNSAKLRFRLLNNVSYGEDEQLDDASFPLSKDRQLYDLAIGVTASPDSVRPGETLTYRIEVENKGPDRADDVELQMFNLRSQGLVLQQASASGTSLSCGDYNPLSSLSCPLGDLEPGEAAKLVTLRFGLEQDLPKDTPITGSFSVASRHDTDRFPVAELTEGDNSASATVATAASSDWMALSALYNATGGGSWLRMTNWRSEKHVGRWYGVSADKDTGRVVGLDLYYNSLRGKLPAGMEDLIHLERLVLSSNGLTGSLPRELGKLSNLKEVIIGGNGQLGGPIPSELGNLSNLEKLHLAGNDLSGSIPTELGKLGNLRMLSLHSNSLTGSIPVELVNLRNLEELYLAGNNLTGCIPAGLTAVPQNDLHTLGLEVCGGTVTTTNGVTAFARNAALDFDTLAAAGNESPHGMWSDGTTLWVVDSADRQIYAYDLSSIERVPSRDFNTLRGAGNTNPSGIWSDGTTMWVSDWNDDRIYAYSMATKQRDASREFDSMGEASDIVPEGIWSDGTTMWVVSRVGDEILAYNLATKGRDSGRDIDGLAGAGNADPTQIWSDGTTMWVSDWRAAGIFAYDLANGRREGGKDFDTLAAAGNRRPFGIWSNGTTMWVADGNDGKIFAYNMPAGSGPGPTVTTATTPTGPAFARNQALEFDTLAAAGNREPEALWTDGTTVWVSDATGGKLYAYNLATKQRDSAKDFNTLAAAGNRNPHGIWSDGTTIWVANNTNNAGSKIYAYNLATKQWDSAKDINTLATAGNRRPDGIWSDGTTMWVADWDDGKLYAYNLATGQRDSAKDFNTLMAAGNNNPDGVWSDGTTAWVGDAIDAKIYAYNMATRRRDSSKDFDTLRAAGNTNPADIWSDGTTMWVTDWGDHKIYAYNMPAGSGSGPAVSATSPPTGPAFAYDPGQDFNRLRADGINFPWGLWSDGTTMWISGDRESGIYAYDVATKDRIPGSDFQTLSQHGNDYALGIWSDYDTMWVADFTDDKIYAYDMATKTRTPEKEFDTLRAAGQNDPTGIWSDGITMWVADYRDGKIYAYNLASKSRIPTKDFNTLTSAGNRHPEGIWSDGTTMWVANSHITGMRVYAYDMTTRARVPDKEFTTLPSAGQRDPKGLWSDGATLWVTDLLNRKVYSYNMPAGSGAGTSVVGVEDFSGPLDANRWLLYGSAEHLRSDESIQLTLPTREQTGILLHRQPVNSDGLSVGFSFEIGGGGGADGLGFLLLRSMPDFHGFNPKWDSGGTWMSRLLSGFLVAFDTHRNGTSYWTAEGRTFHLPNNNPSSNFVALAELGSGFADQDIVHLETKNVDLTLRNSGVFDAEVQFGNDGRVRVYLSNAQAGMNRTLVIDHTIESYTPFNGYFGFIGVTGAIAVADRQVIRSVTR